ncbi:GTP-binding protein GEM-like [Mytilus edulis]|uniref:Uncharacterized protein n=1 Tax=Mytilus edulis TaxID=6550 RepID=A0A8S3QK78_MYTED|nr:unnamed protein product [Mytilus edulis]
MTIDHYVDCKVCHGSSNSFIDTRHMSQSLLFPGDNVPRSRSFREQNEQRPVLPLRSGSFRDPGEIEKERKRPRSKLNNGSSGKDLKVSSYVQGLRRRSSLPLSTPNLHQISLESKEKEHSVRRVRSFKTTTKGLVNRGDSFRKKGDRVPSSEQVRYAYTPSPRPSRRVPLDVQVEKTADIPTAISYYKVVVLGSHGVGKTAITHQFMTSEYVAFDNSIDHGEGNSIVPVQLNGEESTLEFLDSRENEINLESIQADAYLVIFSIAHRDTFDVASDLLSELRVDLGSDRPIVLVGNKLDLVRKRKVNTEEAQDVSTVYDAKYMEVSAGINHNIDELLVGILALIKYKLNPSLPPPTLRVDKKKPGVSRFSFKAPIDFFSRMYQLARDKFRPARKTK